MSAARILKAICGVLELVLGIPVLGGLIVIGMSYTPLGVMFVLHLITLILSLNSKEPSYGPVVGIITSIIAWIPIVGMIMHIISGILLLINSTQRSAHRYY